MPVNRIITVLVIPADDKLPMRLHSVSNTLEPMQDLAGGSLEILPLHVVEGTLWFNEEGRFRRLPYNRRATEILEGYNSVFRGEQILGDAFITGPGDSDGFDTDVRGTFARLIREEQDHRS